MFWKKASRISFVFSRVWAGIKNRYFIFPLLFLAQFIFLGLLVYQNARQQILLERIAEKIIISDGRDNLFSEKLNSIEAGVLRLSAQVYRCQPSGSNK